VHSIRIRREADIRELTRAAFATHRARLIELVPKAAVEHIGSTAVPGSLTKGDVDLLVRVPRDGFSTAAQALGSAYAVHQPEHWTSTFASFADSEAIEPPVGVQLVVSGSSEDKSFGAFRDALIGDPALLTEYNDLKRRLDGEDYERYTDKKAEFVERVLGQINDGISEIARYWDEQAPSFDDAPDHGLRDPAVRSAWGSLLIPLLPPAPARIADIGCGTGSLSVLLAEAGYRVSGIDLAPGMVERARSKAILARVDADFAIADAMMPPWAGGTFDVVLARHLLWALPDAGLGLQRWGELLKSDGRLVLIEGRWWTGEGLPSREALRLVRAQKQVATLMPLSEPIYWGGPISDERYLILSAPAGSSST
jgi:GrpB-like predicted nucleotidyltransferase (UPF0157 family)/protein-L-isoaspartate O-methyltransferase